MAIEIDAYTKAMTCNYLQRLAASIGALEAAAFAIDKGGVPTAPLSLRNTYHLRHDQYDADKWTRALTLMESYALDAVKKGSHYINELRYNELDKPVYAMNFLLMDTANTLFAVFVFIVACSNREEAKIIFERMQKIDAAQPRGVSLGRKQN